MHSVEILSPGGRIRAIRKKREMSQKTLAAALGIMQGSLSDIETGATKEISGTVLAALCRELSVSAEYIMFGSRFSEPPEVTQAVEEAQGLLRDTSLSNLEVAMRSLRAIAVPEERKAKRHAT